MCAAQAPTTTEKRQPVSGTRKRLEPMEARPAHLHSVNLPPTGKRTTYAVSNILSTMVTAKRTTEAISNIRSTCVIPCRLSSILAGSRRSTLGFAGYLEEATFDNDFISIGSFSISMPPRQCVSESSIVGTDTHCRGGMDIENDPIEMKSL